jgi:protein-S-isoprenylcysteine O-methyltransferase Ste14
MTNLTAITAFVLALVGLIATFGWRSLAHRRATGTTGFSGVPKGPRSLGWWGGVLFVLALSLTLAAPALALAGVAVPPAGWPHPLVGTIGVVTTLAGIALALVAQGEMGAAWRIGVDPGERTTLVTTGVFAHVRNPFFTAMVAAAAGLAALVPTAVSALALVCLIIAVEIQVRSLEEPHLMSTHSLTYAAYAAHTGSFLPRLGRLTTAERPSRPRPSGGAPDE